jgi:hypothetical protein
MSVGKICIHLVSPAGRFVAAKDELGIDICDHLSGISLQSVGRIN